MDLDHQPNTYTSQHQQGGPNTEISNPEYFLFRARSIAFNGLNVHPYSRREKCDFNQSTNLVLQQSSGRNYSTGSGAEKNLVCEQKKQKRMKKAKALTLASLFSVRDLN